MLLRAHEDLFVSFFSCEKLARSKIFSYLCKTKTSERHIREYRYR